jgi:hypothetical protein
MADESAPPENEGHCAGITQAGTPCGQKLLRFLTPDGRRWCSIHAPEDAEPDRLYVGPTRVTVPCAGLLRDGTPCLQRGNRPTKVAGKEVLLCSWHAKVYEEHHVLKPPPRKRKQVTTVDTEEITEPEPRLLPLTPHAPLPGEDAQADGQQGEGAQVPQVCQRRGTGAPRRRR